MRPITEQGIALCGRRPHHHGALSEAREIANDRLLQPIRRNARHYSLAVENAATGAHNKQIWAKPSAADETGLEDCDWLARGGPRSVLEPLGARRSAGVVFPPSSSLLPKGARAAVLKMLACAAALLVVSAGRGGARVVCFDLSGRLTLPRATPAQTTCRVAGAPRLLTHPSALLTDASTCCYLILVPSIDSYSTQAGRRGRVRHGLAENGRRAGPGALRRGPGAG